jgi:hypothetical protein
MDSDANAVFARSASVDSDIELHDVVVDSNIPNAGAAVPAPALVTHENESKAAPPGGIDAVGSAHFDGTGRQSRASTESEPAGKSGGKKWQISLDFMRSHIVEDEIHVKHPKPQVRHFYKRQNEIIDNLISWTENMEKEEGQENDGKAVVLHEIVSRVYVTPIVVPRCG